MKQLQEKLFNRQGLSQEETCALFNGFVRGEKSEAIIAATLVALKMKGEVSCEVAGAADALRANAKPFPKTAYSTADSCGTGGSGQDTLNISTMVAFIAAAGGLPMVKHGNRSISSLCGSADLLEQFGVKIDMNAAQAKTCLDELGITFLFAPLFHPGVKHVMPVRNQLATRTIFNLLGPLINPASPEFQLMGVYEPQQCFAAADSLRLSGTRAAMVVHSCGCDEITLAGPTHVAELRDGEIIEYQLNPVDFGLNEAPLSTIKGGTPAENAKQFSQLLGAKSDTNGELSSDINSGLIDTVAANAGTLFYLAGLADSLKAGVVKAKAIIKSGAGLEKLKALAELSQQTN